MIPVEDVATQATAVGNLIRGFATNLAPDNEIEAIRAIAPQLGVDIDLELKSTKNILKEQPSLETLEAHQQIWQQRQAQLTAWLNVLTRRATKLQVALNQLKKLHETWARTRDAEQSAKAPPSILKQIDATLATIEAAEKPHQAERDEVLNLQSKVAELVASCNTALAQITALQQMAVGGIFTREGPPIWNPNYGLAQRLPQLTIFPKSLRLTGEKFFCIIRDPSRHMPRHVGIFLALSFVLLAARRQIGQGEAAGDRPSHGYRSVRSSFRRGVAGDLDGRHGATFAGAGHSEATVRDRRTCAHHHPHPALAATYCHSGDLRAGNFVRHRYHAAGDHW